MIFGEKVRALREECGLTQEELAKRTNVSKSMICRVERGTIPLSIGLAKEIARALGCKLAEIVGE